MSSILPTKTKTGWFNGKETVFLSAADDCSKGLSMFVKTNMPCVWQTLELQDLDPKTIDFLPTEDYHGIYFGEDTELRSCDCGCGRPTSYYRDTDEVCWQQTDQLRGYEVFVISVSWFQHIATESGTTYAFSIHAQEN